MPTYCYQPKYIFFINIKPDKLEFTNRPRLTIFVKLISTILLVWWGLGFPKILLGPPITKFSGGNSQNGDTHFRILVAANISKLLQRRMFVPNLKEIGPKLQPLERAHLYK